MPVSEITEKSADELSPVPAIAAHATPAIAANAAVATAANVTVATAEARLPLPAGVDKRSILWYYVVIFILFHLLIPLAFVPYFFSWTGLLLIPLGNYIFCSTGIGLCYHRMLTHQGLKAPKWLERTLATLGVCSLMDSPARWVTIHRMHHQHTDRQPDPHSPLVDFFWGHVGWLVYENKELSTLATYERYARDILQDRYYMWIERYRMWIWIYAIHAVLFFAAGLAWGWLVDGSYAAGVQFGSSLLLWGVVLRTVYTWHITWAVNSVAHMWGYRNYETGENSRNNWLVALATNGEGWHNNHHHDQVSARHGHRWWELDVTFGTIWCLERLGLVWDVARPRAKGLEKQA